MQGAVFVFSDLHMHDIMVNTYRKYGSAFRHLLKLICMTETNLNAHASQLAVDASYYDQKAQECWDILSQIDGNVTTGPDQIVFSVSVGNQGLTALPIHLSDITTINGLLVNLLTYYRSKYAKAQQDLHRIMSMQVNNPLDVI